MYELKNDEFYDLIDTYSHNVIDYCILKDSKPYSGEDSHRKALAAVMHKYAEFDLYYDVDCATAVSVSSAELLALPEPTWRTERKGRNGTVEVTYNIRVDGGEIPYWQAFMKPPCGEYQTEDFMRVNSALFNAGTDHLEILKWSTDWAEYFDDGREWWGTLCVTVYDRNLDRYVVITAAATD